MSDAKDQSMHYADRGMLLIAIDHIYQAEGTRNPVLQAMHMSFAKQALSDLDERLQLRTAS